MIDEAVAGCGAGRGEGYQALVFLFVSLAHFMLLLVRSPMEDAVVGGGSGRGQGYQALVGHSMSIAHFSTCSCTIKRLKKP